MSIRISLAWSFSQRFFQFGLTFIGGVVIARLLTPEEVGIFSIAMAASVFISAIKNFGIGNYIIREQNLTDDKIKTAFGVWIIISWSLALTLLLLKNNIASFYQSPGIADVISLLSLGLAITPFGQPAHALLRKEMRFDILHHITLASSSIGLVLTITLALQGFSYMSMAWGLVVTNLTNATLLIAIKPNHLTMLPSLKHFKDVCSFGGLLTLSSFFQTLCTEGVKFIIARLLNPASLAIYERGSQIPKMAREGLLSPLAQVLTPAYSKALKEKRPIENMYLKSISYSTTLIWPASSIISLLAEPIILTLFGENWLEASKLLPYLLLSQCVKLTTITSHQILVAHGKVKYLACATGTMAICHIMIATITLKHGLEAFASSLIAMAIFECLIMSIGVRSASGIKIRKVISSLTNSALTTLFTTTPIFLILNTGTFEFSIISLIGFALLSFTLWVISLKFLNHPVLDELIKHRKATH